MNSESEILARVAGQLVEPDGEDPKSHRDYLDEEGVDVDGYLSRMSKLIRTEFQKSLKEVKLRGRDLAGGSIDEDLAQWSREKLCDYLERAKQGLFGSHQAAMAQACYRNKDGEGLADEELRSLVADIKSSQSEE